MIIQCLILVVSLALIIKGGDLFVSASVRIAEFLRLPRVVIGSTLVSLATTSPELVVSIMSGLRGESGLAVGNAVGSSICNLGLILGFTASLKPIDVHPRTLRTPLVAMFLFAAVLFFITLDLRLSRLQGAILLVLGLGYFVYDFSQHKRDTKPQDIAEASAIDEEKVAGHSWLKTRWGTTIQFLCGVTIVILGSKFLIDAAVNIASALGIPTIIIGLTIVAFGTSLPELVTAITSLRQNVSDLAVGNVLGANIANLSLIIGSAAAIHEVAMDRVTQLFNFPALLIGMVLLLYVILSDRRIKRIEGVGLLTFYGIYITALVSLAAFMRS